MRVAILGAGGIGLATAALLASLNHDPILWSPTGRWLEEVAEHGLQAHGALTGHFRPRVAHSLAEAASGAAAIIVAIPGNGRRALFESLLPLLHPGQTVIVSADLSLGAEWFWRQLPAKQQVTVVAWSTTVVIGRRIAPAKVEIGGVRSRVEHAALPEHAASFDLCTRLFGDRFAIAPGGMLSILLGNLNPPVHMANALCNLTRIEKGETWSNYNGITPAVARLIEDLDQERLALAANFGLTPRTIEEHFRQSFDLPGGIGLAKMAAEIHRQRGGPPGPKSLDTRFLTEDLPFGIVPLLKLAKESGRQLPLHEAGLRLLSSACGIDFTAMNDLLWRHPVLKAPQLAPKRS